MVPAASGSAEQAYEDVQGRLYAMDPASGNTRRLGSDFGGSWDGYAVAPNGGLLGQGLKSVETQLYRVSDRSDGQRSSKLPGVAGQLWSRGDGERHAAGAVCPLCY